MCCRYRGGLEYDQNAHDQTLILAQLLVQFLVLQVSDDIKLTTGYGYGYGLVLIIVSLGLSVRCLVLSVGAICSRYRGGLEYDQTRHDQTLRLDC